MITQLIPIMYHSNKNSTQTRLVYLYSTVFSRIWFNSINILNNVHGLRNKLHTTPCSPAAFYQRSQTVLLLVRVCKCFLFYFERVLDQFYQNGYWIFQLLPVCQLFTKRTIIINLFSYFPTIVLRRFKNKIIIIIIILIIIIIINSHFSTPN